MNIFDILGPVMVGPSSSHTAGAVRIGNVVRALLGNEPKEIDIKLYRSFAETGAGHGTDRALIAGALGMKPDDLRIPDSFQLAEKRNISIKIQKDEMQEVHPNTAIIKACDHARNSIQVQACSLGGGRIMINKIDGVEVSCTASKPTLIVHNMDQPGCVADVAAMLTKKNVNIAQMQLYRNRKGGQAVMVVETDQQVPQKNIDGLAKLEGILKVTYLEGEF